MTNQPYIPATSVPILQVSNLSVHYGQSHALQGVDLTLQAGALAVVGRNGMGKTTLCKSIMGIVRATSGSIRFGGEELLGLAPGVISRKGIGYVPQGRRLWPSLTVDEHLRLSIKARPAAWSVERIYDTFPRLAERRHNGGAQLSGGEQQMLAISRALLLNPRLLIMDEPTEGLAPIIVNQVKNILIGLAAQGEISVLVIEQNIGVATAVSDRVAIMVNGRVNRIVDADLLAADKALQQRLLGVGRHAHEVDPDSAVTDQQITEGLAGKISDPVPAQAALGRGDLQPLASISRDGSFTSRSANLATLSDAHRQSVARPTVLVAGALDVHLAALHVLRDILRENGVQVRLADLSTRGKPIACDVTANQIAMYHPRGSAAVFVADEARAAEAMAEAVEVWLPKQDGLAGILVIGDQPVTGIALRGLRSLPIGVPKVMVSAVSPTLIAELDPSDVTVMRSVAQLDNINPVTRETLSNAALALAGMVTKRKASDQRQPATRWSPARPILGLTVTATTRPGLDGLLPMLETDYDCVVFDALSGGGRALERLVAAGRIAGVLDIAMGDVGGLIAGGDDRDIENRLHAIIQARIPFVGSCGGLDAIALGGFDALPTRFRHRNLHRLTPVTTLMRMTAADGALLGRWIGERLNQMTGPVRFFLPERGLSTLDAPGQAFYDPDANKALFETIKSTVHPEPGRQILSVPHHINDGAFAAVVNDALRAIEGRATTSRRALG